MFVELKHSLRRYRGQIIGWGIGLALLGLLIVPMFDSLSEQQETFEQLLEIYPPEISAFMGDLSGMTTPEGWLAIEFFSYMPLIIGIFAIQMGSGLVAKAEEEGTLDLIMAHPVSRTALFMGRLLAFILATLGVLFIAWLGIMIPMSWSTMDLRGIEVARPFLSLLAELLLFGTLALLLSMLLPSRRLASMTSGLVLVASFFITGLAELNENLETAAKFSPLNYNQTQEAFHELNLSWLAGLFAISVVFILLTWWRFERRDLRVAGEGGWRLGKWAKALKRGA
ncbi:MAG: hypothetical protein MAG431_01588 [Chloroflexi bacterium]|nr:hypothetical protein [Chloroflexota bacterium]